MLLLKGRQSFPFVHAPSVQIIDKDYFSCCRHISRLEMNGEEVAMAYCEVCIGWREEKCKQSFGKKTEGKR
jgi:hypothetical protein